MRRFAGGKELAPLGDLPAPDLARELLHRISLGREEKGEAWTRHDEAKLAKKLWRETGALTEKRLRMDFIRVAKHLGRSDLTCPKLWRHQMATAVQSADVDPFVRKELIGHTRLETTRLYTHTQAGTLGAQMGKVLSLREDGLRLARERLNSAPLPRGTEVTCAG